MSNIIFRGENHMEIECQPDVQNGTVNIFIAEVSQDYAYRVELPVHLAIAFSKELRKSIATLKSEHDGNR